MGRSSLIGADAGREVIDYVRKQRGKPELNPEVQRARWPVIGEIGFDGAIATTTTGLDIAIGATATLTGWAIAVGLIDTGTPNPYITSGGLAINTGHFGQYIFGAWIPFDSSSTVGATTGVLNLEIRDAVPNVVAIQSLPFQAFAQGNWPNTNSPPLCMCCVGLANHFENLQSPYTVTIVNLTNQIMHTHTGGGGKFWVTKQ